MYYIIALVDTGYLIYGLINEAFVKKLCLPYIEICLRDLVQLNVVTLGLIWYITYAEININGYKRRLYFYLIPNQKDDIVLEKAWMVTDNIIIKPVQGLLYIDMADYWVKERQEQL